MKLFYRMIVSILALVLLSAACASVQVNPDVTEAQVREVLNAARFSGAETKSPYEYYSALLYYERAIVEQENGNVHNARRYLARAHEQATLAYNNAKRFRKNQ